jgi:UDP-N-acetylmuramyl tripeptide synthase
VAAQGPEEYAIPLSEIPLTYAGAIDFQVENAMAAIAAAWALGLDWQVVRRGLAGFVSDAQTAPGRFNQYEFRGATVFADYGHNPDAIQALVRAMDRLPAKRRSVVISAAGDRRDIDIRKQTEILGAAFDRVVLYEDQCQRGRADGEVLALLRQGLEGAARARDVREVRGEFLAIDIAMDALEPGDLCLILVDQVEASLAHIERRIAADVSVNPSMRPTADRSIAH